MDEPTGETGRDRKPPGYLAFAPAIFLAIIMSVVYGATLFVSESSPEMASTKSIAELKERATELAKEIMASAVEVIEPSGRPLFQRPQAERKKADIKLGEPSVILDFTDLESVNLLKVKSSPDMKSAFGMDAGNGAPAPGSAKLSVSTVETAGRRAFVSGRINLPGPTPVGDKEAFALYLKGEGMVSVRVSALEKSGENFMIWEKRDVPVSGNWTMVTIPFADCDIWLYDTRSGRYTRSPEFSKPGHLAGFRVLVQPGHLRGAFATLWIDSLALR